MPIPAAARSSAEDAISEYRVGRVRPGLEHLLEMTHRFEGNNVYLVERRPLATVQGPLDPDGHREVPIHGRSRGVGPLRYSGLTNIAC